MTQNHNKIIQLDDALINQIAAGEIIDRPASIVKELVENSIDAGASQVTIDIKHGGLQSIKITDNGDGMVKADIPLALSRHATSKLKTAEDLFQIHTLGFRGEAVPSIASVSKFSLVTRHQSDNNGWKLYVQGQENSKSNSGKSSLLIDKIEPTAFDKGTEITVSELFFNTPARRKFMKQEGTEFSHIDQMIRRMAMAWMSVGFTLTHNGKTVFDLPVASSHDEQEERLKVLLGEEFIQNAIYLESSQPASEQDADSGLLLRGWISKPTFTRVQANRQFTYLNNRFIRDKQVMHAIKRAYSDVVYHDRYPVLVLFLSVNPSAVDVNVHPQKTEVRFHQAKEVHDFVYRSIKQKLSLPLAAGNALEHSYKNSSGDTISSNGARPVNESRGLFNKMAGFNNQGYADNARDISNRGISNSDVQQRLENYQQLAGQPIDKTSTNHNTSDFSYENNANGNSNVETNFSAAEMPPLGYALAQMHGVFILAENADGMIVVDMHAAHERILYEQLKQQWASNALERQGLLVPISLSLDSQDSFHLQKHIAVFNQSGFAIEALGENAYVIREVPALIAHYDIATIVSDMIADLADYSVADRAQEAIFEVLSLKACHQAIRANDALTISDMNTLLRQIETTESSGQCNHGRPTYTSFTLAQIDKWFKRGQ